MYIKQEPAGAEPLISPFGKADAFDLLSAKDSPIIFEFSRTISINAK
jgi:hypothetical protein